MLDGGDYEQSAPQIQHMVQLIRLGSETSEKACDSSQDQGFVYVPSPSHEVRAMKFLWGVILWGMHFDLVFFLHAGKGLLHFRDEFVL